MLAGDVQLQHTQVSAVGDIEPLHVGMLFEALGRLVHVPPEAFVERETQLQRSDDDATREVELSDTQWNNVRRAREQVRIMVRSENGSTQFVLPQPPTPPGANPTVAVRSVVLVADLTPVPPAPPLSPLDASSVFATSGDELAQRAQHRAGWDELVRLLNWTPLKERIRYGLRYVLTSENPLVLHELRIYRALDVRIHSSSDTVDARYQSTGRVDPELGDPCPGPLDTALGCRSQRAEAKAG